MILGGALLMTLTCTIWLTFGSWLCWHSLMSCRSWIKRSTDAQNARLETGNSHRSLFDMAHLARCQSTRARGQPDNEIRNATHTMHNEWVEIKVSVGGDGFIAQWDGKSFKVIICDTNRCHSPLAVVSESKVAEQEIPKAIPRRKRHFAVVQLIGWRRKDIVYRRIAGHRGVGRNVSVIPPRLARVYNPRQHFYNFRYFRRQFRRSEARRGTATSEFAFLIIFFFSAPPLDDLGSFVPTDV